MTFINITTYHNDLPPSPSYSPCIRTIRQRAQRQTSPHGKQPREQLSEQRNGALALSSSEPSDVFTPRYTATQLSNSKCTSTGADPRGANHQTMLLTSEIRYLQMSGMILGGMIEADHRLRLYEYQMKMQRRVQRDQARWERYEAEFGAGNKGTK